MNSNNHLGLFAKFWHPGAVKTRIAAKLGNELAASVYQCILTDLVVKLESAGDKRELVFFPESSKSEFSKLGADNWDLQVQCAGGLGEKLTSFFEAAFEKRSDNKLPSCKVVVIGSDCPHISKPRIQEAFERLDQQPVVLGPSTDGGYYLIGMKEHHPQLFEKIDWSTPAVFKQTVNALDSLGLGYELLEPLTDIDELEDLQDFIQEQDGNSDFADLTGRIKRLIDQSGGV